MKHKTIIRRIFNRYKTLSKAKYSHYTIIKLIAFDFDISINLVEYIIDYLKAPLFLKPYPEFEDEMNDIKRLPKI